VNGRDLIDHALIFSGLKKTLNKFLQSEKILVYLPPLNFEKRVVHPHFSALKFNKNIFGW